MEFNCITIVIDDYLLCQTVACTCYFFPFGRLESHMLFNNRD